MVLMSICSCAFPLAAFAVEVELLGYSWAGMLVGIIGDMNLGFNISGVSGGDDIVIPGIIGGGDISCGGSDNGGGGGILFATC